MLLDVLVRLRVALPPVLLRAVCFVRAIDAEGVVRRVGADLKDEILRAVDKDLPARTGAYAR